MTFDKKLKAFRLSIDFTQEDMAQTLGIGRTTYTNIERGFSKPTALFINCLCAMYGLDKNELLNDGIDSLSIQHNSIVSIIEQKYNELDDKYKLFILKQINELLELQQKI